jgi:SAM-dependent methyltransferase
MATHISMRETQFRYFDKLLGSPVWKGSKILDFGGNVGGFLVDSEDRVDHNDYWCLDVTQGAIQQGQSKFLRAHFVFYNRYSSYFNPNGIRNLPIPDLGVKFDIIMAFSVFTHTHRNEMLELVEQLHSMLAPQGVLAFTFSDPSYNRSLSDPALPLGAGLISGFEWKQATSPSPEIESVGQTARRPNWCVEVDDKLYIEPGDEFCQQERDSESYCSYFTADYMASLFPGATVLPPVSPEWQHCCILKETE